MVNRWYAFHPAACHVQVYDVASLIKHRSGLYYVQFSDKTRRPQKKRLSLKTKRLRTAERLKARLEEQYLLGQFDPWAAPEEPEDDKPDLSRLGSAVDAYLAARSHLKPKTLATYDEVLSLFKRFVGEGFLVARLRADHVQAFLNDGERSDVTRRKYNNHLGYLFRYLVREGWMQEDLSKQVRLRRVPDQAPKSMTPGQVELLVRTIEGHMAFHAENPRVPDYRWLVRLIQAGVHLGLRRGEIIHLRWRYVDLERRTLRVANGDGFSTKSGKERVLPLAGEALRVLRDMQAERSPSPDDFVFRSHKGQLKPSGLSHAFLKFRREAKLPEGINLHSLRHTYATWLAERGVPVGVIKELMGHSTITTTERYMQVRPATTQHWVNQVFG